MKTFFAFVTACLLALSLSADAGAQTRNRRTSTPQRRRSPAPAPASSAAQMNAARLRVADQVKKMTRFLYLYGRFSKDLELTGSQTANSEVSARTRAQLLDIVRGVASDLDRLEADFRLTPGLQRHYASLQGVAQRAADAEGHVSANRLDQAGRTLVEVVNQLTDVLLEM